MKNFDEFSEAVVQIKKDVKRPNFYCKTAEEAVTNLGEFMSNFDREMLVVINCDNQCKPINYSIVSIGDATTAIAHPREIMKAAILSNAYALLIMHNHVNKDSEPSKEDIRLTNRMIKICSLIGIPLWDHIIVTKELQYFSFREHSMMKYREFYCSDDLNDVIFDKLPIKKEG